MSETDLSLEAVRSGGKRALAAALARIETDLSAPDVANLLDTILATLDREISTLGDVGNGDVLQALAMALAVRTRMLSGNADALAKLSDQLLDAALQSRVKPDAGNLDDEQPRAVH